MGFTNDLLVGVAQLLEDAGAGTWAPTGAYPAGTQTIIKISDLGGDFQAIVLSPYAVSDDPTMGHSVQGVQVRTRGDRTSWTVDDLDDLVFNALQGLDCVTLSTGIKVVSASRRGGTPLGVDQNNRHQRSSNYHLTVHRPSPHRD